MALEFVTETGRWKYVPNVTEELFESRCVSLRVKCLHDDDDDDDDDHHHYHPSLVYTGLN